MRILSVRLILSPLACLVVGLDTSPRQLTQQLRLIWQELGQGTDFPAALSHHRLDHRRSFAEHMQCFPLSWKVFEMLVRIEMGINFPHDVGFWW